MARAWREGQDSDAAHLDDHQRWPGKRTGTMPRASEMPASPGKRPLTAGIRGPVAPIDAAVREFLVDELPLDAHQMLKGDFLSQLEPELLALAGADCRYVPRYLARYRAAPAAKCELFICRWVPDWREASDARELMALVIERAAAGIREWRETKRIPKDVKAADPTFNADVPAAGPLASAPPIERVDGQSTKGLASTGGVTVNESADEETLAHELVHVAQAQLPDEQDRGRDAAELEAAELARQFVETGHMSFPKLAIDLAVPAADEGAKTAKPASRLGGRPFAVEGDAGNPRILVSVGWVTQHGVRRGTIGELTGRSHPKLLRALLQALLPLYPYVKQRGENPLANIQTLTVGISDELWKTGEQEVGVGRSLFLHLGLPPEHPVQVFPTADGIEIYADTAHSFPSTGDEAARATARRALARLAREAVEKRIGSALNDAQRPRLDAEIEKVFAGQDEKVIRATMSMDILTEYFGDQAIGAYANKEPGETAAVITLPSGGTLLILARDEAEKQKVIALLKELFGDATVAPAGTTGQVLVPADIDALLAFDKDPRRKELLSILNEMRSAKADPEKWNAPKVRDMLALARETLESREANKKLGREEAGGKHDGILPYPVPGEIINLSKEINLGMRAEFEFRVTGTTDPREWHFADPFFFHQPEATIDWYAIEVDEAGAAKGAPEGHERIKYRDAKNDGWLNDKRFEHKFEKSGLYEIHAYVSHSMFQPAHFQEPVEIITEQDRLKRLEHRSSETWGVETSRTDKVFRNVDDNRTTIWGGRKSGDEAEERELDSKAHDYARGSRAEGRLTSELANDPISGAYAEERRLEAEIEEMDNLESQYPGSDRRSKAMREHAQERREKLEKSLERTKAAFEEDVFPVQVQGNYASRTHGVSSGPLNLVSYFKFRDSKFHGELLDHSEIVKSEHFRFRQEAPTYEAMMERLFDDLTITYPDGSMSFAFQVYDQLKPTDRFVRFTRKTDTVAKDFREAAYDDKTRAAVNLIALILTLFPPTAPLGIGLGLVYNGLDVLSELDDAMRTDTVTTAKVLDVGLLALDILPVVGALSKTRKIGRTTYHLIEATQLAGSVYLLADGVQTGIVNLRDGLINQLAAKHVELAQLQRTNAASPEAARLAQEIRGLESDIHGAAKKVFAEVVASQGLQLASQSVIRHIAGDFFSKRPGDADDDSPDATPNDRSPSGTRGKDVYKLNDVGNLPDTSFKRLLKNTKNPVHAKFHEDADNLKGTLVVDVGAGNARKVDLEFVLKPELDASRGHDGDAGPGSVTAKPPVKPDGRWTATVEISSRVGAGDVKHVVGHELAEVVELVRRYEGDPRISIEAEHQASMFKPGAPKDAKPSAHDVAAARELDSLFEASRKTTQEYAKLLAERNATTGASVPLSVFDRHLQNMQRIHRKLAAMGFQDGSDPRSRLDVIEKHATSGKDVRDFVEQYLKDPNSQLPEAASSAKHKLLTLHADQLRAIGIDEALSQRLLDRGILGKDIVKIAQVGGPRALELLHDVVISPQHATSGVGLVEALATLGELDKGIAQAASLQRFASEGIDVPSVVVHIENPPHFEALSWLVGHPSSERRLELAHAEKTLKLAEERGVSEKIRQLLKSGALRNPAGLARFIEGLPKREKGNRLALEYAIEHAATSDVTLEGPHGDVVIHGRAAPSTDLLTVQAKAVESLRSDGFADNVYEAIDQLRGDGGELPTPGSTRVALIELRPDHVLFSRAKSDLINSLRYRPADYIDLTKPHTTGGMGWDRIEVRAKTTFTIVPTDL